MQRKPSMMTISKYNKDMPAKVFEMACQNTPRTKICEALGITLENFRQFLEKYHEFANAYKLGKETFREEMLYQVENEIFENLKTRKIKKERKFYSINEDGEKKLSHVTVEETDVLPEKSMLKFIAKNLDPEKWGDNKPLDSNGESLQIQGKEWAEYIMQSCGMDNITNGLHIENRGTSRLEDNIEDGEIIEDKEGDSDGQ